MANLISVQDLKDAYLTGVKLTDNTGTAFPNVLFQNAIRAAVSWFELSTKIRTTTVVLNTENHDYYVNDYLNFAWINLYEYPVQSVQSIIAVYPTGQTILLFPSTWIKLNMAPGQIQMVPTAGTLTQVLIGQGGSYIPLLGGRMSYLPQLFQIAYTAGFAQGLIPDAVNDVIALRASMQVMDSAGTIVMGQPGIGNKSIGIDGLSQSVSAMVGQFGPYSGRINSYQKRIDDLIETITWQYKGIRMAVI